jgi:membrane-bound lytic murein transglycosylase B
MPHLLYMALALFSLSVNAQSPAQLQHDFIATMQEAHDFQPEALRQLFASAKVRQPILNAISRPAEKRLDWGQYRKLFVTSSNIRDGVQFWRDNQAILAKAHAQYGVPPEIIVAIIGVETRYGRNTGHFPVLDALFTLSFHYPKRGPFFRDELRHFLLLTREEGLDPRNPKGSYAGAMGRPQFISSSYRHYAIDFDNDGKRDIWRNNADVIGSVAHYFAKHGWRQGMPVARRVSGVQAKHQPIIDAGYKPGYAIAELRQQGVQIPTGLPDQSSASLLAMHIQNQTEYWLGLDNFYVITRYNHSPLYAMAVYQLSQAIHAQYE